ncbi:uncharacterized protein L3040_007810 [Drepanopeziza brunnea f. sp. 'multigermtubi']|uniref:Uncharacterized protein n=1 Tax=Marssonina brunnea f. sp. multigermtubi (strain MB_m1) TaxID=1072389 RepID=K1WF74_MARBU|nr:uncharacterized protein MBM_05394 [Drepanopeziza brunnea f. sp. 'multigermtubi' MB_m1]EKD16100.1 hypothetical protein MBM_05394 [Drepanopeziza brunnea f. sp. 'multigermtubi' MB_m1]KAJ5035335.1 hypothetical protein L3040_007810 [Drepanopeziza brunnea f. sp. 'multigermtubi']
MAPLGLARTFPISRAHPNLGEVTGEKWVYGGNPFAEMLAARTPLENPNDLSQLRDIPKKKAKKLNEAGEEDEEEEEEEEEEGAEGDFILTSTTPDLVTIFDCKPYAGPLNTHQQPKWFQIEERILMAAPNIFRQALASKKKADRQDLARAVYNPDTAKVFNPHIPHTAIYLQSLLVTRLAQNSEGFHCLEDLDTAQIWTGVLFWGYFQTHGRTFPAKSTEEIIVCAMLVGLFLGDDAYYGTVLRMVLDRRYAEVWPRVHDLVTASLPDPADPV